MSDQKESAGSTSAELEALKRAVQSAPPQAEAVLAIQPPALQSNPMSPAQAARFVEREQERQLRKLDQQHATTGLRFKDMEGERAYRDRRARERFWLFGLGTLVISGVIFTLIATDNTAHVHTIVGTLAGLVGGYGFGYSRGKQPPA